MTVQKPAIQSVTITANAGSNGPAQKQQSSGLSGAQVANANNQAAAEIITDTNQAKKQTQEANSFNAVTNAATRAISTFSRSPYASAAMQAGTQAAAQAMMPPGMGAAAGAIGAAMPALAKGIEGLGSLFGNRGNRGGGGEGGGGGGPGCRGGGGGGPGGPGTGNGPDTKVAEWGKYGVTKPEQFGINPDKVKEIKETENRGVRGVEIASQADLDKVLNNGLPTIIKMGSDARCNPCSELSKQLPGIYQALKGKANIVTIDVDKNPGLAQKYMREGGIPQTVVLDSKGNQLAHIAGNAPDQIKTAAQQAIRTNEQELQDRIAGRPTEKPPETQSAEAGGSSEVGSSGLSRRSQLEPYKDTVPQLGGDTRKVYDALTEGIACESGVTCSKGGLSRGMLADNAKSFWTTSAGDDLKSFTKPWDQLSAKGQESIKNGHEITSPQEHKFADLGLTFGADNKKVDTYGDFKKYLEEQKARQAATPQ